jgi:hypothetical protein
VGHEVSTVARMGWRGKGNGELLGLAAAQFDVFVTADRNHSYQQNVNRFDLALERFYYYCRPADR